MIIREFMTTAGSGRGGGGGGGRKEGLNLCIRIQWGWTLKMTGAESWSLTSLSTI